jgi:hypothetical protein
VPLGPARLDALGWTCDEAAQNGATHHQVRRVHGQQGPAPAWEYYKA